MPEIFIDINCDLGESAIGQSPDQLELLDYVSSCNIATGFHAGDPHTMYRTILAAQKKGVAIGAHPAYSDKANFGRKSLRMSGDVLFASLIYQTAALSGMCSLTGSHLHHIKLHGALYHDAHHREEIASVVIRFLRSWPQSLLLYGQSNTLLSQMAIANGIKWVPEAFTDRRYGDDGRLLPRSDNRGVLEDPTSAISQAIGIIRDHQVTAVSGQKINVDARTLCIHGDHPNALDLARQLRNAFNDLSISIKSPDV